MKIARLALSTFALLLVLAPTSLSAQDLLAIDSGGTLHRVDPATAGLTTIGSTGVSGLGAIAFAPDGTLYAATNAMLYRINPSNAQATAIVPITGTTSLLAKALAITPNGSAYIMDDQSWAQLHHPLYGPYYEYYSSIRSLSLSTGQTTLLARWLSYSTLSPNSQFYSSALTTRSDGALVFFKTVLWSEIQTVDPLTGAFTLVAGTLSFPSCAATLGSVTYGVNAFASTLIRVDMFTGTSATVGSFPGGVTITGLAGYCAPAIPGSFRSFGSACPGLTIPIFPRHVAGDRVIFQQPPGVPYGTLGASGTPERGDSIHLAVGYVPPYQPAVLFLGFSNSVWNGLALPLSLASVGFRPDCTLQVDPVITLATSTDGVGFADVVVRIPNEISVGLRFYTQFVTGNVMGGYLPFSFTNGVESVVGRHFCQ